MAEQMTKQQERAAYDRGGTLLVSAAAGSGKTKVLVDRLMGYLTDPQDRANIDEFLIITYTKAAASELRGKIAAKLSEKIAERPDDRHLQQQLQRLYMTQISTVHAFCGELLRQFAYRLDLSADIRVADENECAQIRMEVMTEVLERAYESAGEDPDFCAFVDSQGVGRNDRLVPELIMKVYDSARCHLDPKEWLERCLEAVDTDGITDVSQTRWGAYLMEQLRSYLDLQIDSLVRCADKIDGMDGAEKPAALLRDTVVQLRRLRNSDTWDDVVRWKEIDYGTLRFTKKFTDDQLKEGIKAVRDACKTGVAKILRSFADPSEQVLEELSRSAASVRGLIGLVESFGKAYDGAKARRRILDFSDLEHRTLDLLLGRGRRAPTAVAREVGARFREVMVDEYQDSNEVQDAIYSALTSERQDLFLVGDVKQSIYQFRLAEPGIFLEKYAAYVPAEEAKPGQGRKVMLSKNFRSGGAVLEAVNSVFRTCMSPEVGGLSYGEDEALHEGIPHDPLGEPEVELYGIRVAESAYKEEAAFVAQRICQLLDGTHMIRDKEALRPIRPEDIVILLRSPGSVGEEFRSALENAGIRCTTGGGGDLLRTEQISVLRSLLQTIHNPRLDIPLVATLASPVFGFTADDLAVLRSADRHCSLYDVLRGSELPKAKRFLELLTTLRREARVSGLSQLIQKIYDLTRIDSLYGAMADGATRERTLQSFFQICVDLEAGGQKDLGRFLEYLDAMEEKGLSGPGEAAGAGCVTIMSIHKSKGLEFPVVILSNLARSFNMESQRSPVLCHKDLGIGISGADPERRVRYPTVAKRAIGAMMASDSVSEELRVLYVAMTRAKDRLIMTYTAKDLEGDLLEKVARLDMGQQSLLSREAGCPGDWVIMSALRRMEAGAFFALGGQPQACFAYEHPWKIQVVEAPTVVAAKPEEPERTEAPVTIAAELAEGLGFRYGWQAATTAPSKQTATQRKGRVKDQEAAENAPEPKRSGGAWRKPSFAGRIISGREYGNALHGAMQYIRYESCTDEGSVRAEVDRLVAERFLTREQGTLVDCGKIARFFETDVGRRLRKGENVLREFKFSVLDEGTAFDPALVGEKILLQGVVDCALMDEDGITVVDFKTDHVTETTIQGVAERYRPQVEAYAEALSRIYERPVNRSLLYFFRLERFVEIM